MLVQQIKQTSKFICKLPFLKVLYRIFLFSYIISKFTGVNCVNDTDYDVTPTIRVPHKNKINKIKNEDEIIKTTDFTKFTENPKIHRKKGTILKNVEKKDLPTYVEKNDVIMNILYPLDESSESCSENENLTENSFRENEGIWF